MGEDIPVIATADTRTFQWQNNNWVEVQNALAADLAIQYQPVPGNLYFVSSRGQAYRYNSNTTFTPIGGSTSSKEICYPGANYSYGNPQVLLLGTNNRLQRWDINSNRSAGQFGVYPVYAFDQDPYGYPYVLYGSCAGGGYKMGYTTSYAGISPIGPYGGCLSW
jgi:hypothetical protein